MTVDDEGEAVGVGREVDRGVYCGLDDGDDEGGDGEEFVRMFEEGE
jgi:hypothetical protein